MELVIILLQLWTQPSVRMLGFGKEFAGFISDPISDLIYNPAYLKTFGTDDKSFNTLQIYSAMSTFNSTMLSNQNPDLEFFENKELLSLFVLYPKIGFAYRVGAWQRFDYRNYYELEPWLYGQEGFLYSLGIGKWVKLGVEYSFSWNNRPDWYNIIIYDSLDNPHEASIMHLEWSNEGGIGIILTDNNKWQFTLAGKKNWEINSFVADTTWFYWPEDRSPAWDRKYSDFYINSNFRLNITQLIIIAGTKYYEKNFGYSNSIDSRRYSYRPGLGIIFQPNNNLFVIGAITYALNKRDNYITSRKLITTVGFDRKFSPILNFRFGNTFIYEYYWETYNFFKNKVNLGLDINPHEKLCLYFATQNFFDNSVWLFGLSFAL